MINMSEIPRTFEFKNRYVITSCIERYQDMKEKPVYVDNSKLLKEEDMKEYSSKGAVITREEVEKLFKELGLIWN